MSHVEETELGINIQRGGCQAGAGSWDTEAAAVGRVDTTVLGEGRCSDILGIHDSECRLCKFVPENLGGSLVVLI